MRKLRLFPDEETEVRQVKPLAQVMQPGSDKAEFVSVCLEIPSLSEVLAGSRRTQSHMGVTHSPLKARARNSG